ncbi:hypothetical protein RAD15_19385 [Bradyrhizobium sp. 14AA]
MADGGDLSITCAGETLSDPNGVCSMVADRGAVERGGTPLAARGGTEPLAVAVGGGAPSVARDEPTLLFADGVGLTADARVGDTLGSAIGGQTLLAAAGEAAPSFDGGGATKAAGTATSDISRCRVTKLPPPINQGQTALRFSFPVLQIT